MAPPEFKALHPVGSAPVIQDGDVTLAETGACAEYIIQTKGNGKLIVAPGEKNYPEYLYWLHFGNGTLQPAIVLCMSLSFAGLSEDLELVSRNNARTNHILACMDRRLSAVPYLAGEEFTAADIMNVFSLTTMRTFRQYSLSAFPNILAYLKRVTARDGYKRAMQKADPDLVIEELIGAPPPPLAKPLAARFQAAQQGK